jgi:UDPglucose 6-dehydrogenase
VNAEQRMRAVAAAREHLGGLRGKTVTVLGLTFKPNTDDTRESPAIDIARALLDEGAHVRAHDPVGVMPEGLDAVQFADVYEALDGADTCIVTVEWPEYARIDWHAAAQRMHPSALVFDGRNCLEAGAVREAGLDYRGVGRPVPETTEAVADHD